MSCKWIEDNEHVVSRIMTPIYHNLANCLTMMEGQSEINIDKPEIEVSELSNTEI